MAREDKSTTKDFKSHIITFRVTEEEWKELENEAREVKTSPHEVARDRILEQLKDLAGMSFGERALYEELTRLRHLVSSGFRLVTNSQLTPETWEEARRNADDHATALADNLLQRSLRNGHGNGRLNGHSKGEVES